MSLRTHYIDASAIVKLIVDEDGSKIIRKYFDEQSIFHTTSLCFSESLGVLKTKWLYRSEITEKQYLSSTWHLLAMIGEKAIEIEEVNIYKSIIFQEVKSISQSYSLDVSDALQLYALKKGILSVFKYESTPILITADNNLANAAKNEGLRSWNFLKEPGPKD
jgi:predicted nucleic acid-binding protein